MVILEAVAVGEDSVKISFVCSFSASGLNLVNNRFLCGKVDATVALLMRAAHVERKVRFLCGIICDVYPKVVVAREVEHYRLVAPLTAFGYAELNVDPYAEAVVKMLV